MRLLFITVDDVKRFRFSVSGEVLEERRFFRLCRHVKRLLLMTQHFITLLVFLRLLRFIQYVVPTFRTFIAGRFITRPRSVQDFRIIYLLHHRNIPVVDFRRSSVVLKADRYIFTRLAS